MTEQERAERYGKVTDDDYWMRGLRWEGGSLLPVLRCRHFKVPDERQKKPALPAA